MTAARYGYSRMAPVERLVGAWFDRAPARRASASRPQWDDAGGGAKPT